MPVGEIAAAITSIKATFDITKAMIGLRDEEAMRAKSIELQALILDAMSKAIEAREAQSSQLDLIRELETEIAKLKAWEEEKQKYELQKLWRGGMTYMLKPEARGTEPPHWLCPNCFTNGIKSFFQPIPSSNVGYECVSCKSKISVAPGETPRWPE